MRRHLSCSCGDDRFRIRLNRNEGVGLAICEAAGHSSLLLDSRDHWFDVVEGEKPREVACRCKARVFAIELEYELRKDSGAVRSVSVELRCAGCGSQRRGMTIEIDYEPTDVLVERPLDPCDDPWLVPRRVEISALWLVDDLCALVRRLGDAEGALCYFAGWREPAVLASPGSICERLPRARSFDLFFAPRPVTLPEALRDAWKSHPVIHVGTPIHMNYSTGAGTLYFVRWAEQTVAAGRLEPQPAELRELATRVRSWLGERFVSERGRLTADNPSEYARLKGGW